MKKLYLSLIGILLITFVSSASIEILGNANDNVINIEADDDTFLLLDDTPSSYSGAGGECVKVNAGETALEFGNCGGGGAGGGGDFFFKNFSASFDSNFSAKNIEDLNNVDTTGVPNDFIYFNGVTSNWENYDLFDENNTWNVLQYFNGINNTGNITTINSFISIQDNYCNATSCYTLQEFLTDTGGGGGGGGDFFFANFTTSFNNNFSQKNLTDLFDVNISLEGDGDLLQYNETQSRWANEQILRGTYTFTGVPSFSASGTSAMINGRMETLGDGATYILWEAGRIRINGGGFNFWDLDATSFSPVSYLNRLNANMDIILRTQNNNNTFYTDADTDMIHFGGNATFDSGTTHFGGTQLYQAIGTAGGQATTTSFQEFIFHSATINDAFYTRSGNTNVTINEAGRYRVYYSLCFDNTANTRTNLETRMMNQTNAVKIGTLSYGGGVFFSNTNGEGCSDKSNILQLSDGEILRIEYRHLSGVTLNSIANASIINLEWLG